MSQITYIVDSFSGGKTSAKMTRDLIKRYDCKPVYVYGSSGKAKYKYLEGKRKNGKTVRIICVMANTGRERPETLRFARKCDQTWNFCLNYVEAVVHYGVRKSSTHKIVPYEKLNKTGDPYREVMKKYGIPNKIYLHCTRELKTNPIESFIREIGWTNYLTAIGYRIDEPKRHRINGLDKNGNYLKRKQNQIYPLATAIPTTKAGVNYYFSNMPFNLELEEHQGNCDLCFKKSTPKLLLHVHELKMTNKEDVLQWWKDQERDFENYTPETREECNPPYRFFRGNMSIHEIIASSNEFYSVTPKDEISEAINKAILLTHGAGEKDDCEESCEPF